MRDIPSSETVLFGYVGAAALAGAALALTVKLGSKAIAAMGPSEARKADSLDKARWMLQGQGVQFADAPEAAAWTDGKGYVVRDPGADAPFRAVSKRDFDLFTERHSAPGMTLVRVDVNETQAVVRRTAGGVLHTPQDPAALMPWEAALPSLIVFKVGGDALKAEPKSAWHRDGRALPDPVRAVDLIRKADEEGTGSLVLGAYDYDLVQEAGDLVAVELKRLFPEGQLVETVPTDGRPGHAGLRLGNLILDARGALTEQDFLRQDDFGRSPGTAIRPIGHEALEERALHRGARQTTQHHPHVAARVLTENLAFVASLPPEERLKADDGVRRWRDDLLPGMDIKGMSRRSETPVAAFA